MASSASSYPEQYSQPATRRYQIREKIFSLGDNFKIKDEFGQDVFIVKSKLFTLGDKLILEDMFGNPLIKIRQELLHLHPTFHLLSARPIDADRPLAEVKKKFTLLRPKFQIHSIFGNYELESLDLFSHSFTLTKNGRTVAVISKKFFSFTDSYGVEISADQDHAFILALTIVLDQIIYDKNNQISVFS